MKKALIALSIISTLPLVGCGGSDSGSNAPTNPSTKPPVSAETVELILDAISNPNITSEMIQSTCNDLMFDCRVKVKDLSRNGAVTFVDIIEKNRLISMSTDESGFWNDAFIKFENKDNLNLSNVVSGSGELDLDLVINEKSYPVTLKGLYIGDIEGDNKALYINLGELVDVDYVDNTNILKLLASGDTAKSSIHATAKFATNDGQKHTVQIEINDLESKGYKAAFDILIEQTAALYQEPTAPENSAPTFGIEGEADTVVGETNFVNIVNVNDAEGDVVKFHVAGATTSEFVSVDADGVITIQPVQENIGSHSLTIYAYDDEDAFTSKEVAFSVLEQPNRAPVFDSYVDDINLIEGASSNLQLSATDPDGDVLTYDIVVSPEATFVQVSSLGNILINPVKGDAGIYGVTATVSDGEYSVSEEFTITVQANDVTEPEEDKTTIEYLAKKMEYSGDIAKLEMLFKVGSDLYWYIDDNDQPVIHTGTSSLRHFAFYPLTSRVKVVLDGYVDEMELMDFTGAKVKSLMVGTEPVKDFISSELEQDYNSVKTRIEFTFTDSILERIMNTTSINAYFDAKNIVTGELTELSAYADTYLIGDTYRSVLKNVLMPYAQVSQPELVEFANVTGMEYYDLLKLVDEAKYVNFVMEGSNPIVYTTDYAGVINRRIDLQNGTMELGFAETDYHMDIYIKEILSYRGGFTDLVLTDDDPKVDFKFEQTSLNSFKGVVTQSISMHTIESVFRQTYGIDIYYESSEYDYGYQTYVSSYVAYLDWYDSEHIEILEKLLTKYISL